MEGEAGDGGGGLDLQLGDEGQGTQPSPTREAAFLIQVVLRRKRLAPHLSGGGTGLCWPEACTIWEGPFKTSITKLITGVNIYLE